MHTCHPNHPKCVTSQAICNFGLQGLIACHGIKGEFWCAFWGLSLAKLGSRSERGGKRGRDVVRAEGEEGTWDFTRGIAAQASPQVILPLKGIIEFSCFSSSLCQGREERMCAQGEMGRGVKQSEPDFWRVCSGCLILIHLCRSTSKHSQTF